MRQKCFGLVPIVSLLFFGTAFAQTRDQNFTARKENWASCKNIGAIDAGINSCTAIILSGRENRMNNALALYYRGVLYQFKEDHDHALADFSQSIDLDPHNPMTFINRAENYVNMKDYDRAIADYTQSINLVTNNAVAYYHRAHAYEQKNDYDHALADYDQAIRLYPKYASAFIDRGTLYMEKQDFGHAIADYDRAIQLSLDDALALLDQQKAKGTKTEGERSLNAYDKSLLLQQTYRALNNRARIYQNRQDCDRAIVDYDQAIKLEPAEFLAFSNRGFCHFQLGHFNEAADDFAQARKLTPDISFWTLWIYLVHARIGQTDSNTLSLNSAYPDRTKWPGPVIELFLGRATPEQVLSAAVTAPSNAPQEPPCEAAFYVGEYKFLHNDVAAARSLLQQATEICSHKDLWGYVVAVAELKRLH